VNNSISKLYVFVVLLFALLIVWTSRWTVFSATALDTNQLNKLGYFATLKVKRGRILADDGTTVLARSVSAGGGTWKRTYPQGSLFSQTVGYANIQQDQQTGLEKQYLKQLENRQETTLDSVFGPISTSNVGNDVYTTLDPRAQALARQLLEGREGSVVAIVPQTGAVVAMYSNPTYNDNDGPNAPCPADDISDADLNPGESGSCTSNLATQGYFVPGSTFKLVTTAAALNTGKYTPTSEISGKSPLTVSGVALANDAGTSYPDETLTYALTNSINTIYAQVGLAVGRQTMSDYMQRFGFYTNPPIDLPSGTVSPSGEFYTPPHRTRGYFIKPTNPNVDLGRMSIGQDKLQVTPLQMAMVVSAIADGGKLMDPRLTTKVVNPDGQVVQTLAPKLDDRVMSAKTSSEMIAMMQDVVEEGTGQAANLGSLKGEVAGKTGTASTGPSYDGEPLDDAWFVGLAPVSAPKIAVAVVLRNIPNGYGGQYSAPIAAQLMQTLLSEGL
jgi:peptidoglycan glycosyltransferase